MTLFLCYMIVHAQLQFKATKIRNKGNYCLGQWSGNQTYQFLLMFQGMYFVIPVCTKHHNQELLKPVILLNSECFWLKSRSRSWYGFSVVHGNMAYGQLVALQKKDRERKEKLLNLKCNKFYSLQTLAYPKHHSLMNVFLWKISGFCGDS